MNRNEYLRILSQRLSVLPVDEYNNIMQYYTEYFEEAGLENEASVMSELGDVNLLADRILQENGQQVYNQPIYNNQQSQSYNQPYGQPYNQMYGQQNQPYQGMANNTYQPMPKEMSTGTKVLLGIVTIPLWIIMGSLVFGFGVASASLLASSVAVIIAGFAVMGAHFATGIAFVGAGCIVVAVGMGMLMATRGVAQAIKAIYRAIFKRSQTVAI